MKATILMLLMLVALPLAADELRDDWIAYVIHHLEATQVPCAESRGAEYREVCAQTYGRFSSFKSDWELLMRHNQLPMALEGDPAWVYRNGGYELDGQFNDTAPLNVRLVPESGALTFSYPYRDLDAVAEQVASTKRTKARIAGFGGVSEPKLIEESRVVPVRSIKAREEQVTGEVTLEVLVTVAGAVDNVKVLRESPADYSFGEIAAAAVRRWKFEPALLGETPVDAVFTLKLTIDQDASDAE